MSSSKHSKIYENILAAADSNELLADLDQCATVLAENSWPKRDHPALQTGSYQPQTAYNIMWTILFKRADTSQMSKEQKDKFIAKQLSFRQNWYITGTLNKRPLDHNSPRKSYFSPKKYYYRPRSCMHGKSRRHHTGHAQPFYCRSHGSKSGLHRR